MYCLTALALLTTLLMGAGFAAPVTPPPATSRPPCPEVLLDVQQVIITCVSPSPVELTRLKSTVRASLQEARNITASIDAYARCHPGYVALTDTQRGSGTGINIPVADNTALPQAVNYVKDCIYPAVRNATKVEARHRMDRDTFEFTSQLLSVTDELTSLVPLLYRLARGDRSLSPGNSQCGIIPIATCVQPDWSNAGQVTAAQDRLRRLVSIAESVTNYLGDLHDLPYWTVQ